MPRWKFRFVGRKKNAIGIFYEITAERDGATCHEAELALYDEFDHISIKSAELIPPGPPLKKEKTT